VSASRIGTAIILIILPSPSIDSQQAGFSYHANVIKERVWLSSIVRLKVRHCPYPNYD
jgi:hypothetical protein